MPFLVAPNHALVWLISTFAILLLIWIVSRLVDVFSSAAGGGIDCAD